MLAGNSANVAGAKIGGFGDLVGGSTRSSPQKEIQKGKFDAVFVAGDVDQLTDGRGSVRTGVVPCSAGEQRERLSVIQEQTRFLVSLNVNPKLVGRDGENLRGVSERQLLSVRQDILRRDGSSDLKILKGAKVGAHLIQGIHRRGVDQVRLLGSGLLRRQWHGKPSCEREQRDCVSNI